MVESSSKESINWESLTTAVTNLAQLSHVSYDIWTRKCMVMDEARKELRRQEDKQFSVFNEFNLLSLNVRGIRTFEKRKAVFSWLVNSDADIIFLQETYSTRDIENIWRKQWKGEMLFSHGSNHSKGVLALRKDNLDFKIHSTKVDSQGRYIFLEAYIQDSPYFLLTFTLQISIVNNFSSSKTYRIF